MPVYAGIPDEGGRGSTDQVRFDQVLSIRDGKVDPLLRCVRVGLPFVARSAVRFSKYRNPNQIVAADFCSLGKLDLQKSPVTYVEARFSRGDAHVPRGISAISRLDRLILRDVIA
jgi:hypothetical protein